MVFYSQEAEALCITRCNMFLRFVLLCAYKDYYDHCDYYDDGNFFRNSVSFPVSEAIFYYHHHDHSILLLPSIVIIIIIIIANSIVVSFSFFFFGFHIFSIHRHETNRYTDIHKSTKHKKKKQTLDHLLIHRIDRMFFF